MEKRRKLRELLRTVVGVSIAILVPIGGGLGVFEVANGVPLEASLSALSLQ